MKSIGPLCIGAACAWFAIATTAHAAVTAELQKKMRAATFEVVRKKPEHDPLSYEKPLPLDLLPFIERNDAYQSIGTAFALGHDTYVTAAHVIVPCIDSQFGPPVLRASNGKVYALDRLLKFSLDQDFAVFTIVDDPHPEPLDPNRDPHVDDAVVAIGNALGEGIVIRDGLFTSETPEDQDGRWKWIRFSAAASPGNSGGPLLDANGRVIGIVIGKSPNENLNYSLPIARVLDAPDNKATFDQRNLTRLPFLHGTSTYQFKEEFRLPLSWAEFVKGYLDVASRHADRARSALLTSHADILFPKGPGSNSILVDTDVDYFPHVITQGNDEKWTSDRPHPQRLTLPMDGFVDIGMSEAGAIFRLHRPGDASDDALYADSKAFMDLAVKALNITRDVGADQVKITSLGKATQEKLVTDRHGRKWQQRTWPLPYLDVYLLGYLLPTPDGYVGLIAYAPSRTLGEVEGSSTLLLDQFDIAYRGTTTQWRAFLRRSALLPKALSDFKLESGSAWRVHSPLFEISIPNDVLTLGDKSILGVRMAFIKNGERLDWKPAGVWWYRDDRETSYVALWRTPQPPQDAELEQRNRFTSLRERRSPYDSRPVLQTADALQVNTALDARGSKVDTIAADLLYGLTLQLDGHLAVPEIIKRQEAMKSSITILEHGQGEEKTAAATTALSAEWAAALERIKTGTVTSFQINEEGVADASKDYGPDVRGRIYSDDVRDYVAPLTRNEAAKANKRMSILTSYWLLVPAIRGAQHSWEQFLSKNHLPAEDANYPGITKARATLEQTLAKEPRGEEWAESARAVLAAYKAARKAAINSLIQNSPPMGDYQARASACPAPAWNYSGSHTAHSANFPVDRPDYSPSSRKAGDEGTAVFSVKVDSKGCAQSFALQVSTGFDELDASARRWIETVEFVPGESDGKPIDSVTSLAVTFSLTN